MRRYTPVPHMQQSCRSSSKSLYIVGIEIRPYWQLRIVFPECTSNILTAAVFLTRLPRASIHPAYMRASSFTSLNMRFTSASLLGCFEYDGTGYGIGMAAFSSGGVEPPELASG